MQPKRTIQLHTFILQSSYHYSTPVSLLVFSDEQSYHIKSAGL